MSPWIWRSVWSSCRCFDQALLCGFFFFFLRWKRGEEEKDQSRSQTHKDQWLQLGKRPITTSSDPSPTRHWAGALHHRAPWRRRVGLAEEHPLLSSLAYRYQNYWHPWSNCVKKINKLSLLFKFILGEKKHQPTNLSPLLSSFAPALLITILKW